MEIGGRNTKTLALIAGSPFRFLFPERNYFRKPWDFFSFPKINYIKSRKISPRQGFKKDTPFVRVTPAQTQPNLR